MSRAERQLSLIEELRRHRRPVSGIALAEALGVSIRTLYRDIASLRTQGATIDAEPGLVRAPARLHAAAADVP